MSQNDRQIINSTFSGNVNSFNFAGGNTDDWFRMMNSMRGDASNGGPPGAGRDQPTERSVRTQSEVSIPTQSGDLGVSNVAGNSRIFPRGAMFKEPKDKTPEPTLKEVYSSPVREPPAWKLDYKIGEGTFGIVFLEKVQMRGMECAELWAVKRLSRTAPNFPAKQYENEIKNLKALSNHEWFVKFNSSYEDEYHVYIAMEYIPIGDMSKTFAQGYLWNESDAKVVVEQLLQGLVVMHEEGITHRDLKPENIFLCLPEDQTFVLRVKIGDFGTSKRIPPSNTITCLKTTTGTQDYMAPEMDDTAVIKTNKVDIWSLGCILYRMVVGSPPFRGRREVFGYANTGSSPPQSVKNKGFSVACEDFLRDVLQPSPGVRSSAEACLRTAWIMSEGSGSEYTIGRDLYNRLSKIELAAPDIDTLSDMVAHRAANNTPARSLTAAATPVSGSMATTPRSTRTFDTGTSRTYGTS